MTTITEADVEQAALEWLAGLGWGVAHGPAIAPETPAAERDDYGQVALEKHDVCCALFHGFDWSLWTTGTPQDRMNLLPATQPRAGPGGRQGALPQIRAGAVAGLRAGGAPLGDHAHP